VDLTDRRFTELRLGIAPFPSKHRFLGFAENATSLYCGSLGRSGLSLKLQESSIG
jgi:hypothetical protein